MAALREIQNFEEMYVVQFAALLQNIKDNGLEFQNIIFGHKVFYLFLPQMYI